MLLRRRGAWRLLPGANQLPDFSNKGSRDSNHISHGASVQGASVLGDSVFEKGSSLDGMGSMLQSGLQELESDEEAEKDDYFSDASE